MKLLFFTSNDMVHHSKEQPILLGEGMRGGGG